MSSWSFTDELGRKVDERCSKSRQREKLVCELYLMYLDMFPTRKREYKVSREEMEERFGDKGGYVCEDELRLPVTERGKDY